MNAHTPTHTPRTRNASIGSADLIFVYELNFVWYSWVGSNHRPPVPQTVFLEILCFFRRIPRRAKLSAQFSHMFFLIDIYGIYLLVSFRSSFPVVSADLYPILRGRCNCYFALELPVSCLLFKINRFETSQP